MLEQGLIENEALSFTNLIAPSFSPTCFGESLILIPSALVSEGPRSKGLMADALSQKAELAALKYLSHVSYLRTAFNFKSIALLPQEGRIGISAVAWKQATLTIFRSFSPN
ncbi:hypothetical protein L2E82_22536 [Cichorium intybus]|uniref:Uncharacterized protein n=1 Tax=Cichorium intybus TaxID=13427 RepID=A0ACB9DYG9_CICIN|nr:hypothetical protein L2E82_22536 [Cichorium intybus]